MRVATLNVENLDLPLGARARVLRPALERLAADILCLQEVNGQRVPGRKDRVLRALDELLEGTTYAGYHRAATTSPTGKGVADVHNLVTLSRWPILEQRQVLHDLLPPPSAAQVTADPPVEHPIAIRFERPLLLCRIDCAPAPVHVVNVHLRAGLASTIPGGKLAPFVWNSLPRWAEGFFLSGVKRSGQALELRLLVDRIFDGDPDARIVVAGDFNAEEHETPLRILVGAPEDTGNPALADRGLVLLDRSVEPGRRYSVLYHGRPQMLDHILASHALFGRFLGLEIHNEALGDEAVAYGKGVGAAGSYHAGVVATFGA
jgi:endonuclease/exonuclease/phosphatase family metal-dependent hydrolase